MNTQAVSIKAGLGPIVLGEVLAATMIIESIGYEAYRTILNAMPESNERAEALMAIALALP